jgi:hypothetical protein
LTHVIGVVWEALGSPCLGDVLLGVSDFLRLPPLSLWTFSVSSEKFRAGATSHGSFACTAAAFPMSISWSGCTEDWIIFLCNSRISWTFLLSRSAAIAPACDGESRMVHRVVFGVHFPLLNHCDGDMTMRFLWPSFPSRLLPAIICKLKGLFCGSTFSLSTICTDCGRRDLGVRNDFPGVRRAAGDSCPNLLCRFPRMAAFLLSCELAPATSRLPAILTEGGRAPKIAENVAICLSVWHVC